MHGTEDPRERIFVYVLGMQGNVWTPAARWAVGESIELRLVPWRDAPAEVRSLNRRDLDDDAMLLSDPWWGEPR